MAARKEICHEDESISGQLDVVGWKLHSDSWRNKQIFYWLTIKLSGDSSWRQDDGSQLKVRNAVVAKDTYSGGVFLKEPFGAADCCWFCNGKAGQYAKLTKLKTSIKVIKEAQQVPGRKLAQKTRKGLLDEWSWQ